ncbi:MAG TPA: hypothetical protein ENI92_01255 [Bacteroidetes bacterium]|nr:hypothetical protein [Bacteroidota bacterium]
MPAFLSETRRWRGFSLYRISLAPGDPQREFVIQLIQRLEGDPTLASDRQRLVSLRKAGKLAQPAEEQPVDEEGEPG